MTLVPKFISHAAGKLRDIIIVKCSGLFDEKWYVTNYPDVKYYKKSPLEHFIKYGYRLGYDPSKEFSVSLYENEYSEVSDGKTNPLLHYLKEGKKKGYRIFPHCNIEDLNRLWLDQNKPLVTVIVPNYNHAPFLKQRLDSIYNQSYNNIHVILMDDVSQDESVDILRSYASRYPNITTLIINEHNSGSPFAQWRKGIENAKGEFIWIAESDDWCDSDFLTNTVGAFRDESVNLSFCRSLFMKEGKQVWTIEEYLYDISCHTFMKSFTMASHECVKKYFSKKNIIPNVSCCVFRRPTNLNLFDNKQWNHMKVCGDWVLYLHLIRGGFISYTTKATNYYRQHDNNTSVGLHKLKKYYEEHQIVREYLVKLYNLKSEELEWLVTSIKEFWKDNSENFSEEEFSRIFVPVIPATRGVTRLPNVAICGFAFSTGGGEKVPIDQANELYNKGVAVTYIDCGGETRNEKIRKKLNPCIPVVTINWNFNLIHDLFEKLGIEVVHTHHASVDYAISLTKPLHVKQVVTLHGMYETIEHKYLKEQMPHLLKNVSQWLFIADKNLSIMEKYGADTSTFRRVYNAVPDLEIKKDAITIRKELGIADDSFVVAIASRAIEGKGWREAYKSVEMVRKETERDISIVFVGDGPIYDEMKNNHAKWSSFVGYSDKVQSYFNAADLVMLPSTYAGESFPLCLLEALQLHKPVVASDIGEIKRLMTTEAGTAGVIVDIHAGAIDIQELSKALLELIENKNKYDESVSISKTVSQRYSMEKLVSLLIDLYMDLIKI